MAHLSELSKESISKPEEVISLGQEVTAKIIRVSREEKRIGLSLKDIDVDISEKADEDEGGVEGKEAD